MPHSSCAKWPVNLWKLTRYLRPKHERVKGKRNEREGGWGRKGFYLRGVETLAFSSCCLQLQHLWKRRPPMKTFSWFSTTHLQFRPECNPVWLGPRCHKQRLCRKLPEDVQAASSGEKNLSKVHLVSPAHPAICHPENSIFGRFMKSYFFKK